MSSFPSANASVALHDPDVSDDVAQLDPLLWNTHLNEFGSFAHAMIMNDFHNNLFDTNVDLDKNGMWIQTMQNNAINVTHESFFQNNDEFIVVETMKTNSNGNDVIVQKTMHVFIIIII